MKFLLAFSLLAAAFAINGPGEMAAVETCLHTAEQCRKF
jgi:hypothetical protein